jgi:hypothetical protein
MAALEELPRTATVKHSADVFHEESAHNFQADYPGDEFDDLIEEPLDTTPIGQLGGPEMPAEEWPEGSGPAGF